MISDVDIERVLRFGRGVFPVHGIVDGRCTCGAPDCEHPGKHPYTPHGFKDAVFTVADFRRLCNGHANLNIAMPTEGLIVPDVDQHRGGDDTWHQLVTELGIADAVDNTVQSLTGRGAHYLFRAPDGVHIRSGTDLLGDGVDVKAEGGYIIAPPSLHHTGRRYEWETGHHPDKTTVALPPDALLARILAARASFNGTNGRKQSPRADETIKEGVRNETLYKLARRLRLNELGPEAIRKAVLAENRAKCRPPLPDREVEAIIVHAIRQADRPDFEAKGAAPVEGPRPLRRPLPAASPFPIDALGDVLGGIAQAIHEKTRAPLPICANSVLAAAALAVQSHADVELPTGAIRPISEFFVTIAESGERKSAADDEAIAPIRDFEQQLEVAYNRDVGEFEISHAAWMKQRDQLLNDKTKSPKLHDKKAALRELGVPPVRPLLPMLLCSEPTIEGLFRLLREGRPSIGLFSDEGGQFIGGHAMSEENRLKTAAGLSSLWDGKPVRRTRQGEGAYVLRGRRVSMHLLVQPGVASRIFSDPVLVDQGVISRILAVQPEIAAGSRFWREVGQENFSRFSRFSAGLAAILGASLPLAVDKRNELQPRKLVISADGRALWTAFTDRVEALMAPNGPMEPVRALANKLGEHAARLAGILTLIEDLNATKISAEKLAAAIDLAQYYASEAIRIRETSAVGEELVTAERLLKWLHQGWQEEQSGNTLVSTPDIYQFGPRPIHDRATAQKMLMLLVEHGWLVKVEPGTINGRHRREVWRIVSGE